LAELPGRATALRVKEAEEGEQISNSVVYLAPPGLHLLVNAAATLSLSGGPKVHHVRPSAEPLFESVASAYGPRAIAVVLTGGGSDGCLGVVLIHKAGGAVIAQDEATSLEFSMPRSAITTACVDYVLPIKQIGLTLVALVGEHQAI
jgi:two-component system chemotaxis response regulator CheB